MKMNKNIKAENKRIISDDEFEDAIDQLVISDEMIKTASVKKGRKMIGRRSSVILPESAIAEIAEKGKKIGLGYQTMLRILILEKLNDERNLTKNYGISV